MRIKIDSTEIEIVKSALCETELGIAGYVEAILIPNKHISFVGRWDNPYKATDGHTAHIAEHVWIDGKYSSSEDENSFNFLPDDCLSAEDIALKIHEHSRRKR